MTTKCLKLTVYCSNSNQLIFSSTTINTLSSISIRSAKICLFSILPVYTPLGLVTVPLITLPASIIGSISSIGYMICLGKNKLSETTNVIKEMKTHQYYSYPYSINFERGMIDSKHPKKIVDDLFLTMIQDKNKELISMANLSQETSKNVDSKKLNINFSIGDNYNGGPELKFNDKTYDSRDIKGNDIDDRLIDEVASSMITGGILSFLISAAL